MPDNLHKGADPPLFHFARENRKAMTEAERILWNFLRNRRLNGFKFRRQHPIADFIADFFCQECNLVIELDGAYHNDTQQKEYDEVRTYELNKLHLIVIRFTNREVIEDTGNVLRTISQCLKRTSSPGTTPLSGGDGPRTLCYRDRRG